MRATPATPPTTPPAMAPVSVDDFDPPPPVLLEPADVEVELCLRPPPPVLRLPPEVPSILVTVRVTTEAEGGLPSPLGSTLDESSFCVEEDPKFWDEPPPFWEEEPPGEPPVLEDEPPALDDVPDWELLLGVV